MGIEEFREFLDALGWELGGKVAAKDWKSVPAQALVAIQFKEEKGAWRWVVTDEDEEGLFVLDPSPAVSSEKRRDFNRMPLAWYHRVTSKRVQKKLPEWEIELFEEYAETISWVRSLEPGMAYTAEVDLHWERYLEFWEKRLLKEAESQVRKPEQARRLVKRGWVEADFGGGRFKAVESRKGKEGKELFPVVLQNRGRGWHPPASLTWTLHSHPRVQELKRELEPLSPKEEFWKEIVWAKSLKELPEAEGGGEQAALFAQAAEGIDSMMKTAMGESENSWLTQAKESESFWNLLQSVVRYGRRQVLFEFFGNGDLEEKVRSALINPPGKKPHPWTLLIAKSLERLEKANAKTTPASVFKYLGGIRDPKSDANPCCFSNPEASKLKEITWLEFRNFVKTAKVKRKNGN
ncbi:hypothetical protein [Roseibacillus persicicus]|nr:hypothetical protein [Roseibacillus persicicus]